MIEVQNISMRYGMVKAIDNISFNVNKGEILGLLGPNGAGKSTAMKILTTYMIPSSGTAAIGGTDILSDPLAIRKKIGYLPETAPLCQDMLTYEYLEFVGSARGMRRSQVKSRLSWVVDSCGLKSVYKKSICELSRGYKQRVGLAQALIHDPEVLILDEPTSGLDPIQIVGIRELIRSLARKKTIIFSTHILQEVTAISDRVVIINEGSLVADGKIHDLEKQAMEINRSELSIIASRESVEKELERVEGINSFRLIKDIDGMVVFELRHDFGSSIADDIDRLIKEKGWLLRSFSEKPITFEETFLSLTKNAKSKGQTGRIT